MVLFSLQKILPQGLPFIIAVPLQDGTEFGLRKDFRRSLFHGVEFIVKVLNDGGSKFSKFVAADIFVCKCDRVS